MTEVWKDIVGFEGRYQVSNMGRVRSLDMNVLCCGGKRRKVKGRILAPRTARNPKYVEYQLSVDGVTKNHYAHRLVAEAFIPNPCNKKTVNHIDENKLNNYVDNLEWATQHENNIHNNMPARRAAVFKANRKKKLESRVAA